MLLTGSKDERDKIVKREIMKYILCEALKEVTFQNLLN